MGYDKLINAIKAYHINIDRKNAGQVCSLVMHSNPAKLQEDGSFSTASMESVLEVYSDINAFLDRFAERAIKEAKKGDIQFAMSVFKFFEHEQYPDCHDICAKDKERCRRELEAGDFDCYWAKGYLEHWRWLELVHETCVDVQLFAKSALQNGMTIRTEVGAFTLPLQNVEEAKIISQIQALASAEEHGAGENVVQTKSCCTTTRVAAALIFDVSESTIKNWDKGKGKPACYPGRGADTHLLEMGAVTYKSDRARRRTARNMSRPISTNRIDNHEEGADFG